MLSTDQKIRLTNEGYFPLTYDDVETGDIIAFVSYVGGGHLNLARIVSVDRAPHNPHATGSQRCLRMEVTDGQGNLSYRDQITRVGTDEVWIAGTTLDRHTALARLFDPGIVVFDILIFAVSGDGEAEATPVPASEPPVMEADPEFEKLLEEEAAIERATWISSPVHGGYPGDVG